MLPSGPVETGAFLGNRPTAGRLTLTQQIMVRIHVPQLHSTEGSK